MTPWEIGPDTAPAARCRTPEYQAWRSMLKRCSNDPSSRVYRDYFGRGIDICQVWKDSYEQFLLDVGPRPAPDLSLDRIDNDQGYFPENVRWATHAEQMRNTRANRLLTFNGETHCAKDWAIILGMSYSTLARRLWSGWSPERATRTPTRKTHCMNGHPFDETNTLVCPNGARSCRACNRINNLAYRRRRRAS